MNLLPSISEHCLLVLDKLTRVIQHELDALQSKLAAQRRAESQLAARSDELRQQMAAAVEGITALQSSVQGIDLTALAVRRVWMLELQDSAEALLKQQQVLELSIDALLGQMESLQRRLRVLQRARQRRMQRLVLGRERRHHREADEQHVLRQLDGVQA